MENKNSTLGLWSDKVGRLSEDIWFGLLKFAREHFEPLNDAEDIGKKHYYIDLKNSKISITIPSIDRIPLNVDHIDIYTDEENAEIFVFDGAGYSYQFSLLMINFQAYILDYIEQNYGKEK